MTVAKADQNVSLLVILGRVKLLYKAIDTHFAFLPKQLNSKVT